MDISVYDDFFVISNVLSDEDIETIHSVYKPIDIGHQSNTSHWIVESDKKTRIEAYNREVTIIGIKEDSLSFISDKIKESLIFVSIYFQGSNKTSDTVEETGEDIIENIDIEDIKKSLILLRIKLW